MKLKPCPCCGGQAQLSVCADYALIFCIRCGLKTSEERSFPTNLREPIVAERWNKRNANAVVEACQRKMYSTLNSMQVDKAIAPILDEELELVKKEFSENFSS